jgi:hypothetical protein
VDQVFTDIRGDVHGRANYVAYSLHRVRNGIACGVHTGRCRLALAA